MKPKHIITTLLLALLFSSCYHPKFGVASARITITKKGINIQPLEKFKRIKDTTFIADFISRIR